MSTATLVPLEGQRFVSSLTASGLDLTLPLADVFAELDEVEARTF